jgi:hypothetical protein
MNKKLLEALKALIPEEKVEAITSAITEAMEEATKELEGEYQAKLDEAYANVAKQLEESEKTAETGYQEAYAMITDLRNRLDTQKVEFEKAMEEGYEEAYLMLQAEKSKNETVEVDMYAEYDKKLSEMKEYIVDKVDEFLKVKGQEIYAQARRDIVNDPRLAEHRVALSKIVDIVSDYITDDDAISATNSKLEEARKTLEEIEGQKRILEARNIRLATENNKLNDAVRTLNEQVKTSKEQVLTEAKKEKIETAKNVQGRGEKVLDPKVTKVITEAAKETEDKTITEEVDPEMKAMQILAGVRKAD